MFVAAWVVESEGIIERGGVKTNRGRSDDVLGYLLE